MQQHFKTYCSVPASLRGRHLVGPRLSNPQKMLPSSFHGNTCTHSCLLLMRWYMWENSTVLHEKVSQTWFKMRLVSHLITDLEITQKSTGRETEQPRRSVGCISYRRSFSATCTGGKLGHSVRRNKQPQRRAKMRKGERESSSWFPSSPRFPSFLRLSCVLPSNLLINSHYPLRESDWVITADK